MNHNGNNIESRLWAAADELRANSKLKSSEYSVPMDIEGDAFGQLKTFDYVFANPPFSDESWGYGMYVRQHGHCVAATEAVR